MSMVRNLREQQDNRYPDPKINGTQNESMLFEFKPFKDC